jgi:hypothetical protein
MNAAGGMRQLPAPLTRDAPPGIRPWHFRLTGARLAVFLGFVLPSGAEFTGLTESPLGGLGLAASCAVRSTNFRRECHPSDDQMPRLHG